MRGWVAYSSSGYSSTSASAPLEYERRGVVSMKRRLGWGAPSREE